MSFVNLALISKSSEPEENHDVLFKASIELDSIAEQLDSINSATSHYCDKKYIETIRNWIKYRKDETTKQNVIISKRRSFSSDSLQVKNLRFNKTYSLIVGLLVVVQIVLACLTIDWSKYSQLKGELLRKSASLGYCIIHYLNLPSQNIRTTMIATTNINLKVPFNEKDQAKSLGARWNAEAKLWYVPQGVEAAPFEKWVTAASNSTANPAPAQAAAKPAAQANAGANTQVGVDNHDDIDAINARLRDAYEPNEDAF